MLTAAGRGWRGRRMTGRRRRRGPGQARCSSGTRLAVGKPSSRPRSSPWATSPASSEGRAEQAVRLGDVAGLQQAADVARGDDLAVEFEQRVHDRREALVGGQQARVALARGCRSGSSRRPRPGVAPSAPTSTSSMNCSAVRCANSASNGITIISCTPSEAISSALRSGVVSSFGRVLRARRPRPDAGRTSSTLSEPAITSRWPRCTPSKVPTATRCARRRARRPAGG